MRVEVYWNLHKGGFSVRALEGPDKGRVIVVAEGVTLNDVTYAVQPAGRAKVLREQRKNVHAFVRGRLGSIKRDGVWWGQGQAVAHPHPADLGWELRGRSVRYNPYLWEQFQVLDGENSGPIYWSQLAVLHTDSTGKGVIKARGCAT